MATATLASTYPMYFAVKLSDNIGRTDEGYLICRNAVIARTGYQTYKGRELPQRQLEAIGLHLNPDDELEVYRPYEEVFSPAAIASFEGKPVSDGHPPGDLFIDSENIDEFQVGHLQNIHKGDDPTESGDWPLLGDVIVTHKAAIDKIDPEDKGIKGIRELSGGYEYNLALRDGRVCQVDIRGNHVALVPKGRAGAEARIKDAAPEDNVSGGLWNNLRELRAHIIGLGLKAFADDAEPIQLVEAAKAFDAHSQYEWSPEECEKEFGKHERGAVVSRSGEPMNIPGHVPDYCKHCGVALAPKKETDMKTKDGAEEVGNIQKTELGTKVTDKKADDKKADDADARLHGALDKILAKRSKKAADADLESLRSLLDEYFQEEQGEGEHAEDAKHADDCKDADCDGSCMHKGADAEGEEGEESEEKREEEEEEGEEGKGEDHGKGRDSLFVEPIKSYERSKPASAATDVMGELMVLRTLRPFIAGVKNTGQGSIGDKLHRAFDACCDSAKKRAGGARDRKSNDGGYGAFLTAATERSAQAKDSQKSTEQMAIDNAQAAYDKRFRKNPNEVV